MDNTRMSLVEHLTDLRRAIIVSLFAFASASALGWVLSPAALSLLKEPLPFASLIFMGPMDFIFVRLRLAVLAGVIFAFPVIVASVSWFIAPALTEREKKFLSLTGLAVTAFFLAGVIYGLKAVLPVALYFLLTFATPEMLPFVAGEEYLTFAMSLLVYSGLAFEMPLILFILIRLQLVSASMLTTQRRVFIFLLTGLAVFFTTGGDLMTQIVMALPLYLMFEATLLFARLFKPTRHGGDRIDSEYRS